MAFMNGVIFKVQEQEEDGTIWLPGAYVSI